MKRPAHRLSLDDVARYPLPGFVVPTSLRFTPDDSRITYLFSEQQDLSQQLYAFDPATGERTPVVRAPAIVADKDLPLEEQLRRERLRERAQGITQYMWNRRSSRLLVPIAGAIHVQDPGGTLRPLTDAADGAAVSPTWAPSGDRIAFVRHAELYVVDVQTGDLTQLTEGAAAKGRTHGLAEYIAQEEMSRMRGFWWSRAGDQIAFVEVDETHIPVYRINHAGRDAPSHEDHRYPFAGEANAKVRLAVVPSTGGSPVWMDLTANGQVDPHYLARVCWLTDGALLAAVQTRDQLRLDLIRLDPHTGEGRLLHTEHGTLDGAPVWVNLHDIFHALSSEPGAFVWASEASGFRHLVRVAADGTVSPLTDGPWMVHRLTGVDEAGGHIYFEGSEGDPRQRHLMSVPLSGGATRRITHQPGIHTTTLDHAFERFVDITSSIDHPPRVTLRSVADGAEITEIHSSASVDLEPPELIEVTSRDGVLLYGALYRPDPDVFGPGPHPLLVHVYGGPHAQRVLWAWGTTVDMRAQYLRERGIAVLRLDNRGSWGRGLAFEAPIRHLTGVVEIDDQVDAVRHLVGEGIVDADRVAIAGWSYGGYASLMALARAPDVFCAAVAGAPVTHWDGYDTHYTERYMGTPQDNPDGYEASSVMAHVDGIRGALLLVHGMIDENVHFRHSARLIDALVKKRIDHELLIFPDERHMPRRLEDRVYLEQRVERFLKQAFARTPSA